MGNQVIGILTRSALYSFIAAIVAGIIYVIIAFATGGKWDGATLWGCLTTGGITFVIAFVFYSAITLYFSRKKA